MWQFFTNNQIQNNIIAYYIITKDFTTRSRMIFVSKQVVRKQFFVEKSIFKTCFTCLSED